MASAGQEAVDPQLAALLTSVLEDFSKIKTEEPKSDSVTAAAPETTTIKEKSSSKSSGGKKKATTKAPNDSMPADVDKMWKELIDADPALKDHWEKLAESCSKAADAATEEEFEKSLNDTLKNLSENAKNLTAEDGLDEDLAKVWSKLNSDLGNSGEGGNLPDIMPMVTNLMQNLLSKSVLYPALKDLTEQYPPWLKENKDKLSDEDYKRYSHQLDLMLAACKEFEVSSDDDSDSTKNERFQRILTVMQQMQECGAPPKDLVGDVPSWSNPAGFDLPKIPGLSGDGSQCSIQ